MVSLDPHAGQRPSRRVRKYRQHKHNTMTHEDTTLQAAIDAALQTNGDEHAGSLVTFKSSVYWPSESLARLAVAKAFLAALPPASSENWQARAEKAEADSVARPSLSRLRPLAEAGPVPEGVNRIYAFFDAGVWWMQHRKSGCTHFADILPPALAREASQEADPYAELKAAHAAGKVIQYTDDNTYNGRWQDCPRPQWVKESEHNINPRYRVKPEREPETFEHEGKTWEPAVGDVVRLKSGGPEMVVSRLGNDDGAHCFRYSLIGLKQDRLPIACLEPVRKEGQP